MKSHHSPVFPYLIVMVLGMGLGAAVILLSTEPIVVTEPAPPPEQTVLVVPDTKVVTKTERVEVPFTSPECTDYLTAAEALRTNTAAMSANQGQLNDILSDMQVAVYDDDPVAIVQLKDRMHAYEALNTQLWIDIGAATQKMKTLEGECGR